MWHLPLTNAKHPFGDVLHFTRLKARAGAWIMAAASCLWFAQQAGGTPILPLAFASSSSTSSNNTGATALLTIEFGQDIGGDFIDLVVANTTPASTGSLLTAVGFEWPAGLTAPIFARGGTGSYFDRIDYDVHVSPGRLDAAGGYDVMITSDGRAQGGSSRGAPTAGQSQRLRLSLGETGYDSQELHDQVWSSFSTAPGPIAVMYFQSVGQRRPRSDLVIGMMQLAAPVPEPRALVLLLAGAIVLRRRAPLASC